MSRLFIALVVSLFATSVRASTVPEVAWSYSPGVRVTSHPAISSSGFIAFATENGVIVLDEGGNPVRRLAALATHQPFWDIDHLWLLRTEGWERYDGDTLTRRCSSEGLRPTLTPEGELLQAGERTLLLCNGAVASRKGRSGETFVLRNGYATADTWWIEFFDRDFKPLSAVRVADVGAASGVDSEGRLLVLAANGHLRAIDNEGKVVWEGLPGDGGPAVVGVNGVVVLGSRSLSLVENGETRWTLPIAAGVRQAAILEGGYVAILERTGRWGLVRDGEPVWAKRLRNAGQFFGVHPVGFVLVQDGQDIVAWGTPKPEVGALMPVHRGLDRSGRIAMEERITTPVPCRHGRCLIRNAER